MRGRQRISMAGVCCYRSDGSDARLSFHLREGAYDTTQLIPIVQALGQLVGGAAPVVLVWDNLPAHTSLVMRAFLATSTPGCRWSICRPTHPTSTQWKAYGPT
jgi:hypothetical protein